MSIKESLKKPGLKKYALVVIITALLVFISGRVSGFIVAEENYETKLSDLTEKYSALDIEHKICLDDVSDRDFAITLLESENLEFSGNLSSCNNELSYAKLSIENKDASINGLTKERDTIAGDYEKLSNSSAASLCCIKKIFDPTLAAYYIENNVVMCTSDASKTAFAC